MNKQSSKRLISPRAFGKGMAIALGILPGFLPSALFGAGPAALHGYYTTTFPTTETPISEGGNWMNGKTDGLDWSDVGVTNHVAVCTMDGSASYNDSTAILTGTWGPNQTVTATLLRPTQYADVYPEVEIRLRSTISAHSCTGYEVGYSLRNDNTTYIGVVRWNGPYGDWTPIANVSGTQYVATNGSTLKAQIIGSTITIYLNGTQVIQANDTVFSNGNPGIGFYNSSGNISQNGTFGFTSFTASDGSAPDTQAPTVPANLTAVAASSSQINLAWTGSTDNVGVAGYQIYRNGLTVGTANAATYSDTGLVAGTTYTYAVAAFDAAGDISAASAQASTTTLTQPTTYLLQENFEGANNGYDLSGWVPEGAPNADYTTTVLEGTQSFNSKADGSRAHHSFGSSPEVWISLMFRANTLPAGPGWVVFSDAASNFYLEIGAAGPGRITVHQGSRYASTVATLSANTTYYLWAHYKADGTGSVEFSTNGTKTGGGAGFASVTGTSTVNLDTLYIGLNRPGDIIIDKLRLSATDPGPSMPASVFSVPVSPITLTRWSVSPSGSFQFSFTNVPGVSFTAFAATNLSAPFANWTKLGVATETSPGQFQFTDPSSATVPQRFYRVESP